MEPHTPFFDVLTIMDFGKAACNLFFNVRNELRFFRISLSLHRTSIYA